MCFIKINMMKGSDKMKKILSVLLVLTLLPGLWSNGGAAFAEEATPAGEPETSETGRYMPLETDFGFRFEYPEEYQNLKGELAWMVSSLSSTFAEATLYYVEVPEEEREAFRKEAAEAAYALDGVMPDCIWNHQNAPLFTVMALMDNDDYVDYYENVAPAQYIEDMYEKPANGGTTYIPVYQETVSLENGWKLIVQRNEYITFDGEPVSIYDSFRHLDGEYRDELLTLWEKPELFISGLKDSDWDRPGEVGDQIAFETKTLQGDPITSEELFSGHKVTMVNIWATWCGPCVREMPQLQKLNASFAEKDCQIVGLCLDALDESTTNDALAILEQSGVTFPNLVLTREMNWANVMVIPTSFFISEDGTILTEPVVGADISGYNHMLSKALEKVG